MHTSERPFTLSKDVEDSCPHCPYRETPQFIETMYRCGHGTWDQLEEYCDRLKRFQAACKGMAFWVRFTMSKFVGVPEHHLDREDRAA